MNKMTNDIGVELLDLADRGQCKYPVHSEGKHHVFCGLPAATSWCETHSRVVWIPPEQRRSRR